MIGGGFPGPSEDESLAGHDLAKDAGDDVYFSGAAIKNADAILSAFARIDFGIFRFVLRRWGEPANQV
ncbi:hypothetical protein LCGC14_2434270, partial [marine sediment metagenome]